MKKVKVHCFVVDEIASIVNVHPVKVKKCYSYIKDDYFSDVCRNKMYLKLMF